MLRQTYNLFRVIFKDTFQTSFRKMFGGFSAKKKNEENLELSGKPNSKVVSKVAGGILAVFGIGLIIFYVAMFSAMFTQGGINAGVHEEILYLFLAISQFVVMFFGSAAVLNYLYFSKDNMLLSTLPIRPISIFSAKYMMAYVSEYLICLLMSLPMLITYGVVSTKMGISISWSFYVYAVLSTFLLPVIPLLVASIISIPLMYIVSFLRKRAVGNAIVVTVVSLAVLAIYMGFIGSVSGMQQSVDENNMVVFSQETIALILKAKKFTVFNFNLANALLAQKSILNFIIYIVELIAAFGIAALLSAVFYNKGMRITVEGSGSTSAKKQGQISYASGTFTRSFVKKEIKTIVNSPQMLVSSLMGVVMLPLFSVLFGKTNFGGDESGFGADFFVTGLIMYMTTILMGAGNIVALVGFSMEGKNLYLLKTLPIKAKDIIKPKLIVSNSIGCILSLSAAVSITLSIPSHNILVGLGVLVVMILGSIGMTSMCLFNDLKAPNLTFKNVTELTKNNRRTVKPMLIGLCIGLYYLVLGIIMASISDESLSFTNKMLVYFGTGLLINALFAFLNWKALIVKAEERYESIEV